MNVTIDPFMLELNKSAFRKELRLIAKEIKQKTIAMIKAQNKTSLPGQAPHSITGALVSSISYNVRGNKVIIRDSQYYARFLAVGAEKTGKYRKGTIEPRYFMSDILNDMKDEIQQRLDEALMTGLSSKERGRNNQ